MHTKPVIWNKWRAAMAAGLVLVWAAGSVTPIAAQDWPRRFEAEEGTISIYQPQLESFENDHLSSRAAVSITMKGATDPVFGAVWFDARVSTDFDTRMVDLIETKVSAVKFPEAEAEQTKEFARILEREISKEPMSISLDRILAGLDIVEKENAASEKLNNAPPEIIFVTEPTVLVIIDGDPILRDVEDANLEYVVNTPYLIVRDGKAKRYYLKGGDYWYVAPEVTGNWEHTENPPKSVVEFAEKNQEQEEAAGTPDEETTEALEEEAMAADTTEAGEPVIPAIIVRTKPAELIQTGGEPDFTPIEGTSLLYMSNAESDVIMDISSQKYYVLLSGRWYVSDSMTGGKWVFVPHDKVPGEFKNIPSESDMGVVKASVAGTQEAREAVLENEIPQTAEVDRKEATVTVDYDGDPKFETITDTNMSYAVNTDKSVLLIDGKYYCCDQAVWFVAVSPKGPWDVCVSVPAEVQTIPPESPVYNVKYVYIYESTPEVVYVGYTPGYMGSYAYGGCVVYGTGYWYQPWYHHYYYPRPVTWGFGVHWNPYSGWGFSFGVSYGWFRVGFGGYGGWWGPAGYRHGYRHGYHRGYRHGARAGYRAGYRAGQRQSNNVYRNRSNGVRHTGAGKGRDVAQRPAGTGGNQRPATQPSTRDRQTQPSTGDRQTQQLQQKDRGTQQSQNNVYTDKNGNVYRNTDKGWEQRDKGGWSSTPQQGSTRDKSQTNRTQQDLNRQKQSRQQGTARTNQYRQGSTQQRQSSSHQRSGSRSGGGGKRRR